MSNNDLRDLFEQMFSTPYEKTKAETNVGFDQSECPYGICDGTGAIIERIDGKRVAKNCKCFEDEVLKRKLGNSNLDESLYNKELDLSNLEGVVLHPKETPGERELKKGKNGKSLAKQEDETPLEYIDRNYIKIEMKNGFHNFINQYITKTLEYLNQDPVTNVKNLMLIGGVGRGKTVTAGIVGKHYIINGKRVYFTTMRSLVKNVIDKVVDIEKIVSEVDLLIIDELGREYHTDSGYALIQIQELLRVRYNKKLPVVCTTNFYPNEIHELYDDSLMSLFHGTYFMVFVDNKQKVDFRVKNATSSLDDFDSLIIPDEMTQQDSKGE